MENNNTYKDINNRQVYPKFKLCGLQNDILTCTLYVKRNIPTWIPFKKSKIHYKEIGFTVATDNLEIIANYTSEDYHNLVLKTLQDYNNKNGIKDTINNKINTLNNLVVS